jgi:broad specificity phosphatase PhoE
MRPCLGQPPTSFAIVLTMNDEISLFSFAVFVATATISAIRTHYQERRIGERRSDSPESNTDVDSIRSGPLLDEDIYAFKRSRNRMSFDHSNLPRDHKFRRRKHSRTHHHFEQSSHQSSREASESDLKSYSRLDDLMKGSCEPESDHRERGMPTNISLDGKCRLDSMAARCLNQIRSACSSYNTEDDDDDPPIAEAGRCTDTSRFAGWRSSYNSKIMPDRIIMVRHGQSEGNVNEALYKEQPDSNIRLTKLGWNQAKVAGRALRNQILQKEYSNESVHFIVSPYVRTIETFHGLAAAWSDPDEEFGHVEDLEMRKVMWYKRLAEMGVTWHEDPRIREQDFGNFQNIEDMKRAKRERHKFGVFYYRFPNGESASDVYDRVSTFLDSLWRSFDANRAQNYILVTHGISIRVLLARYFRYSIDQFNMLANPRNCEMVILGHDGNGKLQLDGRCELELSEKKEHDTKEGDGDGKAETIIDVTGVKFYKKLRIVPKNHVRSRIVRLSCD